MPPSCNDCYTLRGASLGYVICQKECTLSQEQIWMRDPQLQCEEEVRFYGEIFEFILEDIEKISDVKGIITEGAAYMPLLMKAKKVLQIG